MESAIKLWRQQEETLLQMPRQNKAMRGKPPKWPEVEQEVRTWILEWCQTGFSVWTKMIQENVKGLHEKKTLMISQGHLNDALTLWRKKVWAWGHKRNLPQNFQQPMRSSFGISFICYQSSKDNFELSQTAGMYEVPLTFDVPSNRTVDIQGAKTVAVETGCHEKSHFTVVLPGVSNLLASLRHNGRRVVLGHTLYTLQHVITKKSHNILSKFMICVGPHS